MSLKQRDMHIDKAKGLLIFFVVFGHLVEKYAGWEGDTSGSILKFIYLIHMPAFILLSGVFFKVSDWQENFVRYFSIFFVFQIAYVFFEYVINEGRVGVWLSTPYWIMWFMFTLSAYCLITPIILKQKYALLISVVLAIYIGIVSTDNYPFSIGRTLSFFPFFLLGALYGKKIIEIMNGLKGAGYISIVVIIVATIACYYTDIKARWLYGVANIIDFHDNFLFGIFVKLSLLISSTISLLALIHLAKFLPIFFGKFGRNSLSIYLLHGFLVMLMSKYLTIDQPEYIVLMGCALASFAILIVFKESIFNSAINSVINKVSNAFRRFIKA